MEYLREVNVLYPVAEAEVAEAESHNVFGAWSDLVVGEQPSGLVETYLLQGDDRWQIVSVWHDAESLDRALGEERTHPANAVFDAAGIDYRHMRMRVAGHLIPANGTRHQ
jgi:hypothetical protein